MFSFKKEIQKIVSPELFNRGIKLYLEGGVIDFEELNLDYWRLYRVNDTYKKETYFVKTPVIHLALKNLIHVDKTIDQFVQCNCQYFDQEKTPCKHIISVFISLENEFNKTQKKSSDLGKVIGDQIFDQIQNVNEDKKFNEWIYDFENWLSSPFSQKRNKLLADIKLEYKIQNDKGKFDIFFNRLNKTINEFIKIWENEKKIHKIIFPCLLSSPDLWKSFWLKVINNIHINNKKNVFAELYKYKFEPGILSCIRYFLSNLDWELGQKDELFLYLFEKCDFSFKDQIEMAYDFEDYEFIWDNREDLDPEMILRFASIQNDYLEDSELLIIDQMKQWLMLINHNDYDKIEEVFDRWFEVAGGITYNMSGFIDYIKKEYKKKRSLVKIVNKYT